MTERQIQSILEYGGAEQSKKKGHESCWRLPEQLFSTAKILLSDWNFVKSIEAKMMKEIMSLYPNDWGISIRFSQLGKLIGIEYHRGNMIVVKYSVMTDKIGEEAHKEAILNAIVTWKDGKK
jgi:hypothetical protein